MRNALGSSLADALEELSAREAERAERVPTFREFLESPDYAWPYMSIVGISPVIGAIVDASEGTPVSTLTDAQARDVFHLGLAELPIGHAPRVVVVNGGRQCGKTSNLLAPKCVHAAWTTPVPTLRPGQVARCVIISPRTDQSKAAFRYCKGIVDTSPRLRKNVVKMTSGSLADVSSEIILLRRPDGHLVEIVVGSADGGGTAARSATLVFAGFDEVAFFFGDDGHTVNDEEIFAAAMGTIRTVPAAQLWMCSTPWIEGAGLMERLLKEHWGQPSDVLCAARMSSYLMRGRPDDGSLREDTDSEDTYRREVLAYPLPVGSAGFFSSVELERAVLRMPPAGDAEERGAGGDFAFEHDASAVAVVDRHLGGLFAVVLVEERHATPDDLVAHTQTVRQLGARLAGLGCRQVMADHWMRTFVREHLSAAGVAFCDSPKGEPGRMATFGAMKRIVDEGRLCLGQLPRRVAEYVRDQLRAVVATPMGGGRFKISIPRVKRLLEGAGASKVGAHGDVAFALVLAAYQAGAGRDAADWQAPRVPEHVRRQALPDPRRGAASSAHYLRGRSLRRTPGTSDD